MAKNNKTILEIESSKLKFKKALNFRKFFLEKSFCRYLKFVDILIIKIKLIVQLDI